MLSNKRKNQTRVNRIVLALKNARIKKGYSRYKISKMTGLSESSLSKIENLVQNPTLSTLIEIAIAIEFDLPQAVKANFPETYDELEPFSLAHSPAVEKINDCIKDMNEEVLEVAYTQLKALKSLKK